MRCTAGCGYGCGCELGLTLRAAQVANVRESSADYRKFYIHTGMQTVSLRAESKCAFHLLVLVAGGGAAALGFSWSPQPGHAGPAR